MVDDSSLLWSPSHPERSQSTLFRKHVASIHGLHLDNYEDLFNWSCVHRADFWSEVWEWEGILGDKGKGPIVDESAPPSANPTWFGDASLNWAENQLRNHATHPDDVAIIDTSEPCQGYDPLPVHITQRQLYYLVGKVQRGLSAAGVTKGHRVAYWGGNRLEAAVVLLATSSIGAIFSSAAADFGVDGVVERLEQIKPRVLFVSNGVIYNGLPRPLLPLLPKLFAALSHPPARTILIPHLPDNLDPAVSIDSFQIGEGADRTVFNRWQDFIGTGESEPVFERMGFNEPIWILFSSGTTGKPKAIVHRQGGMLIDSLREHHLAGDMARGDVFFYYTTPGWMMFQYLVSGLATGATIVLYEGSPLKRVSSMWEMVDNLNVTIFGTSAKYIEQISKHYPEVGSQHSLHSLRQILSTGSPLPPHLFDFVYTNIKSDVLLGSVTGGTDICSVFAGRNTCLPVFRGEIQSRMLGFALDTTDATPGAPGELICTAAFPVEPLGFWPLPRNTLPDGDNISETDVRAAKDRFLESYFKDASGTWYHGDYVKITQSREGNGGGIVMLGRSDGVLNPNGIRFGPTDIYSVLETPSFSAQGIEETLAVGLIIDDGADEKVVLFVKMRSGSVLMPELEKLIKSAIRSARSARHVPSRIIQVDDVPITLTGKKIEVPIRKLINGAPISSINPATLRNSACLDQYVALGEALRLEEH